MLSLNYQHASSRSVICDAAVLNLFWHMQAGYELFDLPQETIDLTFGAVTLMTGTHSCCTSALLLHMQFQYERTCDC